MLDPPLTKLSGSVIDNLYLLLCIGSLDVRKGENTGSNMIALYFEIYAPCQKKIKSAVHLQRLVGILYLCLAVGRKGIQRYWPDYTKVQAGLPFVIRIQQITFLSHATFHIKQV